MLPVPEMYVALDWTKDERQILAKQSRSFICPQCGAIEHLITAEEETLPTEDMKEIQEQLKQICVTAPVNVVPTPDKSKADNALISPEIASNKNSTLSRQLHKH